MGRLAKRLSVGGGALLLLVVGAAHAATIRVDSPSDGSLPGKCTLHDAIIAANTRTAQNACDAGTGNDTIEFLSRVAGRTIILTATLPSITSNLTIKGPFAGIVIDGHNTVQVMSVGAGATLSLDGLTIAHGHVSDSEHSGGGIENHGTLNVTNTLFTENVAAYPDSGGAISNVGALNVKNSIFTGNRAAGDGGAIQNGGVLNLSDSTFTGNTGEGEDGGAILNNTEATAIISGCTFSQNHEETRYGGAIGNFGALSVINSTFWENSASSGGAIGSFGTVSVINSTFAANTAKHEGGTIEYLSGTLTLKGSILAVDAGYDNCSSTVDDAGYNITTDLSCYFGANSTSLIETDPKLAGVPADHGGPTQTIALAEGSPAIDAIPFAACTDGRGKPLATDQRGFGRPDPGDKIPACDIGAFESGATPRAHGAPRRKGPR
jgi:hypothetical protein